MVCDITALYVFKSLYESGSAKVVSDIYGMSPSKVSRYITILRDSYSDTLFIRKRAGFIPSERSRSIYPMVCAAIDKIESTGLRCNNSESRSEVVIITPDFMAQGLLSYLERFTSMQSSQCTIVLKSNSSDLYGDMLSGRVCMALGYLDEESVSFFRSNKSLKVELIDCCEEAYLIASEVNPIWQGRLSIESIADRPFASINHNGDCKVREPFEIYCNNKGLDLNVKLKTNSADCLLGIISNTYTVSISHSTFFAKFMSKHEGIRVKAIPSEQVDKLSGFTQFSKCYLVSNNEMKAIPINNIDDGVLMYLKGLC